MVYQMRQYIRRALDSVPGDIGQPVCNQDHGLTEPGFYFLQFSMLKKILAIKDCSSYQTDQIRHFKLRMAFNKK
jgi:hypothetical protein